MKLPYKPESFGSENLTVFIPTLVERIRLAGKLPDDDTCVEQTDHSLKDHLNLLKGLWVHQPLPTSAEFVRSEIDRPRPTAPDQKFIHNSWNLTIELANTVLNDARLFKFSEDVVLSLQSTCESLNSQYAKSKHKQIMKLVEQLPDEQQKMLCKPQLITKCAGAAIRTKPAATDVIAQRLLDYQQDIPMLSAKSFVMVQRLAETPNLALLFHQNYKAEAIGAGSRDEIRKALSRLHTLIKKLTMSPHATDDNCSVLTRLSERLQLVESKGALYIGTWRAPEQARRITRDMLTVELRVLYRLLSEGTDKHTKRDRFSATYEGHENEPTDSIGITPFASLVRLVLEHIEDNETQIPGETLADIITRACSIVDPLIQQHSDFDMALRYALNGLHQLHNP